MKSPLRCISKLLICLALAPSAMAAQAPYDDLLELFHEWRAFEQPPSLDGAPDYRAETFAGRQGGLAALQARLQAFEIEDWPIEQQVDWHLLRAEMNGMLFNLRVLRPWERDPAFYTSVWTFESDTPAHEGPNHHALVELWTYAFPLSADAEAKLTAELATIPPLLRQARGNLVGNARELWEGGITNLVEQSEALAELADRLDAAGPELLDSLREAREATDAFIAWLRAEAESKTGPSGIGKAYYTWHLRNVHLVPLSWEQERSLLKRELDRAHATLRLEEHRNADLPPLRPIATEAEYAERAEAAVRQFVAFLGERSVLPKYDYIEPALRAHMGSFVPAAQRNFFARVAHHEPLALWTHWYHWFDLARIKSQPHPSPVRRGALLYNIFDSRSEGMATGFEEMAMHAGLFDDNPRARELVYIMLAQRAARGLGSLEAHANRFTLKEARDFHVAWTPRGWMREDLDLLGFEQLLYLRQPGYGTSYVTGKYLLERLLAERGRQLGDAFRLAEFFRELDEAGVIPVSLLRWQLTGKDDEIRALMAPESTAWPESAED
ncbi:MAG: DUF885 family protein [Xanthomonadales bacterium]|nr:DUF885 family protein [Xanthomonadales bacterium]